MASWEAGLRTQLGKEEEGLQLAVLAERTELVMAGLRLAQGGAALMASTLGLFRGLEQPLTRSALTTLGEVVVEVKRVQQAMTNYRQVRQTSTSTPADPCPAPGDCRSGGGGPAARSVPRAQPRAAGGWGTSREAVTSSCQAKKGLVSDKKYSEARLDMLSCLLLAERAMTGPPTMQVLYCTVILYTVPYTVLY